MDIPNNVKGFELLNPEKVERALVGTVQRSGSLSGGVQAPDGTYDADALLAEYDRMGGLIRKGEDKVKTGSFFDFKAKKPREKATPVLEFRINGRVQEVPMDAPLPPVVRAAKLAEESVKQEIEERAEEKAEKKASKNK